MQHKRFRSSCPSPSWNEVMIQQGPLRGSIAVARHRTMKPQAGAEVAWNGSVAHQRLPDPGVWSIGKNKRRTASSHNAAPSPSIGHAGGYFSGSATQSGENWSKKSTDPTPLIEHEEQSAEDQADSSVTAEAIAVESLLALDVLAHCAVIQSQIHDSAASACRPPGRRVFVQSLGFSIFQRRRGPVSSPSRPSDGFPSKPSSIGGSSSDEEERIGRPKRKRATLLPSKFQDSVLMLKNKNKKSGGGGSGSANKKKKIKRK